MVTSTVILETQAAWNFCGYKLNSNPQYFSHKYTNVSVLFINTSICFNHYAVAFIRVTIKTYTDLENTK